MKPVGWAYAPNSIESICPELSAHNDGYKLSIDGRYDLFENDIPYDSDNDILEQLDAFQKAHDEKIYSSISQKYDVLEINHNPGETAARWVSNQEMMPLRDADEIHGQDNEDSICKRKGVMSSEVFNQVVDSIRNLELRDVDGDGEYDISMLELHEVEFAVNHAQRIGGVDFFSLVREVHAVRRRLLYLVDDPDSVVSDNLDRLIDLIEERYEESFRKDAE